jgi:hypothetical protein
MSKKINVKDMRTTPYLKAVDIISNELDLAEFERDYMIWVMTQDIISGQLKLRDANSGNIVTINDLIVNGSVEINDLNEWLKSNDYKFNFSTESISKININGTFHKTASPSPVNKSKVAAAFQDTHYSYDQWKKYLATPPDWLKPCRVSKGSKGRSGGASWDPVKIGLCLLDKEIAIKKLDFIFHSHLNSWVPAWKENTLLFRD